MGHLEWKPQRAVFVADTDQAIWIVENPEAVGKIPAAHVKLTDKFDSAKKTMPRPSSRLRSRIMPKRRPGPSGVGREASFRLPQR